MACEADSCPDGGTDSCAPCCGGSECDADSGGCEAWVGLGLGVAVGLGLGVGVRVRVTG